MQVAGGRADVLDVLRQDRSQELTGRGPSACGVLAAARNLPSVVPDPRNRGEARSHGRANDQLGLPVLSLRKSFRVIFTPPYALGLMTRRTIVVDSEIWRVYPTGRITVYGKDEFGLLFELGTGPERKRRFTRYSPLGSKSTDASLAELTERQLLDFFRQSQPAWTSPEAGYGAL